VKLRTRIFLSFLAAGGAALWYGADWLRDEVRPHYLKSMEDSLVDTANVLAVLAAPHMTEDGRFDAAEFRPALDAAGERQLSARIYDIEKTRVDLRVYVTDAQGLVVFDSDGGRAEGEDYSQWNDVYLTLRGRYGARSTRVDPEDPGTSVLHVGAPVVSGGRIVGALTVGKPVGFVHRFITQAKRQIAVRAALAAAVLFVLCYVISLWVTGPIGRLTAFARAVRDGRRPPLPRLGRGEMADMGRAFDEMREALEGRRYVEQYVQTLTHEIKSPLSAIRGAAELLAEEMPAERRARFTANIRTEADRIGNVVERLLELAALENRQGLQSIEEVDLAALAAAAIDSLAPSFEARRLTVKSGLASGAPVCGERFLLRQALANLLQNAIDFSPEGGEITVTLTRTAAGAELAVSDRGPGVPDYAIGRVFEKFYSLPRPDSGRKSTGLGLALVREVAELHGGAARIENLPGGGARAVIVLPAGRG
jgi:two-component system sensor histidine kinase CreC